MPDISVIIPAYNRSGLIGETLRSLLNQTLPAKEIIVVDDGSTDGTAEKTLEAFENWKLETGNLKKDGREQFLVKSSIQHPTLKILHQANAGPGAARNRGLAEATGEFIHFFDSDDIAAPNKHEVQLQALLETGADIAYGPWVIGHFSSASPHIYSGNEFPGNDLNSSKPKEIKDYFLPEGMVLQKKGLPRCHLIKALLTNWSIVPHACMFRREIVEKAGGFPINIRVCEDQLMFLRCLLTGAKVVHSPGTIELYRLGTENKLTMRGSTSESSEIDIAKFLIQASRDCQSHGISPTEWISFRIRAWASFQEMLKICISCEDDILKELAKLFNPKYAMIYFLIDRLARWVSAAKAKLGLGRQNSAFQSGHITEHDKMLLQEIGIKII